MERIPLEIHEQKQFEDQYRVEIKQKQQDEEYYNPLDSFIEADRWMIGRPMDKQGWAYYDRMIGVRERNAKILGVLWPLLMSGPFLTTVLYRYFN